MNSTPLVSVLINNYNYARFLGAAIDSALGQDYPFVEVIVVDDGSTDDSCRVIASYGRRVIPILTENGGQASAFNAGAAASRGEILCFLDSDDVFYPQKVGSLVRAFAEHGLNAKPMLFHHLLRKIDGKGEGLSGPPEGRMHASPMNLYAFALKHHFLPYEAGTTSSISINRTLADRLFPIPHEAVRMSADDFIVYGASLVANLYSLGDILGDYRVHGGNAWYHRRSLKSREFMNSLQSYLNSKLSDGGLSPVISFNDSIRAWPRLLHDRRFLTLAWHMLKICIRDHDRHTFLPAYYTVKAAGKIICEPARKKASALLSSFHRGPAA
jgi:glycosyltransferase involved in cell wall biosynthesis